MGAARTRTTCQVINEKGVLAQLLRSAAGDVNPVVRKDIGGEGERGRARLRPVRLGDDLSPQHEPNVGVTWRDECVTVTVSPSMSTSQNRSSGRRPDCAVGR